MNPTPERHADAASAEGLVVGAGFTIEGHVRGRGTLHVHGRIVGDVDADVVCLEPEASIAGRVVCRQLDVSGRLDGGFEATDVVVRAGAQVAGSTPLVSRGVCTVAGDVRGTLQARLLQVPSTGRLEGTVVADRADVHGAVVGELQAGHLVVRHGGRVQGEVRYAELAFDRGAVLDGQLRRVAADAATTAAAPAPVAAPAVAVAPPSAPPPVQPQVQVQPHIALQSLAVPAPADASVRLELPEALRSAAQQPNTGLRLTQADGRPAPAWIGVDADAGGLRADRAALSRLQANGETVAMRVSAGAQTLVFRLPP